jgi:hypothetical protein
MDPVANAKLLVALLKEQAWASKHGKSTSVVHQEAIVVLEEQFGLDSVDGPGADPVCVAYLKQAPKMQAQIDEWLIICDKNFKQSENKLPELDELE